MESWDIDVKGRIARANATRAFCVYMDDKTIQQHVDDRKLCTTLPHSDTAKKRAREIFAMGHFYLEENNDAPQDVKPIPLATEFRVYEPDNRDDLVTIVLPPQDKLPPESIFVARDHYRCTYWPYLED